MPARTRPSRWAPFLGVAAFALVVAWSGIGMPWWPNADPDGAYNGSGINILLGNHTQYLDHPGLPTQDALAIGYGALYLLERASGDVANREEFATKRLGDLDGSRWLYRGWALFLFIGGAVLVTAAVGRFLGHWTWGVTGGLLYLASPGLQEIAYMLRPDSALAALCVLVSCLVAAGFDRRRATLYLAAGFALGLTLTFKIAALPLAIPLVVAALWRRPAPGWSVDLRAAAARGLRRHRAWLVPAAAVWVALCLVFNKERLPVFTNDGQRTAALSAATFIGGFAACTAIARWQQIPVAQRLFSPFNTLLVLAFAAGIAWPASLIIDDGLQALVATAETVSGGRVNERVDAFADFDLSAFFRFPLSAATVALVLVILAAVRAVRERVWWPLVLCTGIAPLALAAAARFSFSYYYAPAFAVAIPCMLWALRGRSHRASLAAWAVALVLSGQLLVHENLAVGQLAPNDAAQALADRLLKPGEVILAPANIPIEDLRYQMLVQGFADFAPDIPYRFLIDGSYRQAVDQGFQPRYDVVSTAEIPPVTDTKPFERNLGGQGPFLVRRVPLNWGPGDSYGVLEILRLPDEP